MAAAAPQEVQLLSVNPGQQARELQPAGFTHPSLPVPAAAPPPLESETEHDRRMRWRVVYISVVIGVYVVVNALVRCIFDLAAMEDMINTVRDVTDFKGDYPSATSFLLNTAPSVVSSIGIGLLVPLCGYLGVKQNQKWLMGCFCGCNAFHCCTAIIGIVGLAVFAMMVQAMAPEVEHFLEKCDPMQCEGAMGNHTDQAHIVDCLAAGFWKDYKPHFAGPRYPNECPPVFLKCDNMPDFDSQPLIVDEESEMLPRERMDQTEGTFDDGETPVRAAGMGDYGAFLSSETPSSTQFASPPSQLRGPHQALRRLRFAMNPEKAKLTRLQRLFAHKKGHPFVSPPMPKDPIEECKPAKSMEQFHDARLLVPELVPKLQLLILVRAVLLLPVVIFGCLGFCWGRELWSRLEDGYNPVGTSQGQTRPQVMLQPALGVATAVQAQTPSSTQMQMAQPLILTPPPVPQPLPPQPQVTTITSPSGQDSVPVQASAPSA